MRRAGCTCRKRRAEVIDTRTMIVIYGIILGIPLGILYVAGHY
jgi:hypothetical protein